MATNFPGPYEVEIFYTIDGLTHVQRLNTNIQGTVTVGQLPTSVSLKTRSGGSIALQTAVQNWVNLIAPIFDAVTFFSTFNFWAYDPFTYNRTFITAGDLSINGANVGNYTPARQVINTFRTSEGNIMKLVFMEGTGSDVTVQPYANADPVTQGIMDFIVSVNNWVLARDTSYPLVALNNCRGQNEKTFRQRFR